MFGPAPQDGFRHQALLYEGDVAFLAGALPFVRGGLAKGEAVLVATDGGKIRLLREALGADAEQVGFRDMRELGRNPARILPAWTDFVEGVPAERGLRGIGEPVWPGRSTEELVECQHHESLLNLAFGDGRSWQLLCPYDVSRLEPAVQAAVAKTHPSVRRNGHQSASADYLAPGSAAGPFGGPLSPIPELVDATLDFSGSGELRRLRDMVVHEAELGGLGDQQALDFAMAANELATNSLRHGGGHGTMRLWREDGALVCEVRDGGRIDDPMAGRRRPGPHQVSGRGLWIANQLCDLLQIRVREDCTIVRAHMRL